MNDRRHTCVECGNVTIYHSFDDEERGDVVDAYCDECERDTDHVIGWTDAIC